MSQDLVGSREKDNDGVAPAHRFEVESIEELDLSVHCRSLADGCAVTAGAIRDLGVIAERAVTGNLHAAIIADTVKCGGGVIREFKRDDRQ